MYNLPLFFPRFSEISHMHMRVTFDRGVVWGRLYERWIATRSECYINLVKYLYPVIPVIYWRLYKFRVGVRDRSYNMHEITIVVSYRNC